MRKPEALKRIRAANKRVADSIRRDTDPKNLYSRGLASEGFEGGYKKALDDVLLLLTGGGALPDTRGFWHYPPEQDREG